MSEPNTLELREKRAKLWNTAKEFLESKRSADGLISDEDAKAYEKMVADVLRMGKDIDMLERQLAIDKDLSSISAAPITQQPMNGTNAGGLSDKGFTGGNISPRATAEYSRAFWATVRNAKSDRNPEILNALSVGSDTEGGYLVPDEFEKTLISALENYNIMRTLARRVITKGGELKIPVVDTRGTASWVDEAALIPESDDTFAQVSLYAYKLATLVKVSREIMEDSAFPLESFLADDFGRRLGALEEAAFIKGDGVKKPTGVLTDAQIGLTAASASTITFDDVIKLFYSLKSPYRHKACFITNEQTVMLLRTLKTTDGYYIWQPSVTAGTPDMLLGKPLYSSDYMPGLAAGAKALMFGDFSYYWIADRQGRTFDRLSEIFSINDQIGFKATQRVDGKLILPEAVKVLQMAAS